MPKPTQYISDDGSNAAYEYNYIYDYPIGDFPMYFPIRDIPDLPKQFYVYTNENEPVIVQDQEDYTIYYFVLGFMVLIILFLLKA